jgi:hypothetical protein
MDVKSNINSVGVHPQEASNGWYIGGCRFTLAVKKFGIFISIFFNAVLAMGGEPIGSLKSTLIVVESSLEAKSSH